MDILHIEQLLYYQRYLFSVLKLDERYNWQVSMAPNMHHSLFKISNLCVLTYTHNLNNTGHIWTSYILINCSTIGDIPCVI